MPAVSAEGCHETQKKKSKKTRAALVLGNTPHASLMPCFGTCLCFDSTPVCTAVLSLFCCVMCAPVSC